MNDCARFGSHTFSKLDLYTFDFCTINFLKFPCNCMRLEAAEMKLT